MEERKLSSYSVFSYGAAEFTFSLMMWLTIAYLAYYMTDTAGILAATMGTMMLITHLADAISIPIAGSIIQKVQMRWGQYRSWLLIAPVTTFIFFTLLFVPMTSMGYTSKVILICIFYVFAHVSINFAFVAQLGLIGVMGETAIDRVRLSTKKGVGSTAAAIVFSLAAIPMLMAFNNKFSPQYGFFITALILAALQVTGYWNLAKVSKKFDKYDPNKKLTGATGLSGSEMLKSLFGNGQLILMMIADSLKNISGFAAIGMAAYYFQYVAGNMALMSAFMLATTVAGFVYSVIAPGFLKLLGKKYTYIASSFLAALGFGASYFVGANPVAFIIAVCIGFMGYSLGITIGPAMYMDSAEYSSYKTGKNCTAFIMSMFTMPIKIGVALATTTIGYGLAAIGFTAGMTPTPEFTQSLLKLIAFLPAVVCLLAGILMLFYKLTDKTVAGYMEENVKRASLAN